MLNISIISRIINIWFYYMNLNINLIKKLKKQKILPIINSINFKNDFLLLTTLLNSNKNIEVIEIALREEDSLKNAIKLKDQFPNLIIGLGSIFNKKQYEEVKKFNFNFIVSPGINKDLINLGLKNYIPGAETITEFNYLSNNNINIIKFFPAVISGGISKLQLIENIYKNLLFIPTGGININNIQYFLNLKNVLCVSTSKIDNITEFKNQ